METEETKKQAIELKKYRTNITLHLCISTAHFERQFSLANKSCS